MKHNKKIQNIAFSSSSYSEYIMKMNLNGFSKAKSHGYLKVNCRHPVAISLIKDGFRQGEISAKFILNCL